MTKKRSTTHLLVLFLAVCFLTVSHLALASIESRDNTIPVNGAPSRSMSMHGETKYPPNFKYFDYVNPSAPKGGTLRMALPGTFDSLNPYIEKGVPATHLSLIYDTLMTQSWDEPFSMYPLLAESVERAHDNSSITFHLSQAARFHDGTPVTSEDVVYTFYLLKEHGSPFYRAYYSDIQKVEAFSKYSVRFLFEHMKNRELPLIIAQLPVLPKHFWEQEKNNFTAANINLPLGSGPYKISSVESGKSISYERVKDYWGQDLPVNKGRYNFDFVKYDYFRDEKVALEALKANNYDLRFEYIARDWATAYDIPAIAQGRFKKELIPVLSPRGMQGFTYNIRRELFKDARVRRALIYALDFEWLNKNLFYKSYIRSHSYFSNSELASSGLPEGDELKLLEPWRDQLPGKLFSEPYSLPVTDGSGQIRPQLKQALTLLEDAGWRLDKGILRNDQGQAFEFEILLVNPGMEKVALPFKKNLSLMGIEATLRTVDVSQYINRLRTHDFDMTISALGQSSSPGNEQRDYWSSAAADNPGSNNLIGIKSPIVDALIEKVIAAKTRSELVSATRALDRVLLWGEYMIPQWHYPYVRIAYWTPLKHPFATIGSLPLYEFDLSAWWMGVKNANAQGNVNEQKGMSPGSPFYLWLIAGLLLLLACAWIIRRWAKQGN